jgi:hypothetical protein
VPLFNVRHLAVRQLIQEQWSSDKYYSAIDTATEPPEPVTRAVLRGSAAELLPSEGKASSWIALTGTRSSGKTQLVLQACQSRRWCAACRTRENLPP